MNNGEIIYDKTIFPKGLSKKGEKGVKNFFNLDDLNITVLKTLLEELTSLFTSENPESNKNKINNLFKKLYKGENFTENEGKKLKLFIKTSSDFKEKLEKLIQINSTSDNTSKFVNHFIKNGVKKENINEIKEQILNEEGKFKEETLNAIYNRIDNLTRKKV